MDYSEVSSAFSKLVETHFLQRCPPLVGAGTKDGATPATPLTPAIPGTPATPVNTAPPTPESFPDCYKVPHVTLIGRGKRQLSTEDGEDQRNAKKAKMDSQVGVWNMFKHCTFNTLFISMSLTYNLLLILYVIFYMCLSLFFAQTHGDEGICWQVNFERFHLHFRDQAIISAVANKLDQVRFILFKEKSFWKIRLFAFFQRVK